MQVLVTPPPAATALPRPPGGSAGAGHEQQVAVNSATLLQGQKAMTIVHNGSLYRLQATRLGKLILTK